jgi:hypothetical protein
MQQGLDRARRQRSCARRVRGQFIEGRHGGHVRQRNYPAHDSDQEGHKILAVSRGLVHTLSQPARTPTGVTAFTTAPMVHPS